jgi:peptidoglycan hydrolase CwlO-like protein
MTCEHLENKIAFLKADIAETSARVPKLRERARKAAVELCGAREKIEEYKNTVAELECLRGVRK